MKYASINFILLVVFATTQAVPVWDQIDNVVNRVANRFSRRYDTPQYEVIQTYEVNGERFEERSYQGDKYWACTKRMISATSNDDGMFMKLFYYIQGNNDRGSSIEMTKPVSMKWTPMDANMDSYEKEMCFYLDQTVQVNPPGPLDPEVYLVKRPAMNVYTRIVPGYMNDGDWKSESRKMDQLVSSQGLNIEQSYFFVNGYNAPFDFWNRRNEVWKVKKV